MRESDRTPVAPPDGRSRARSLKAAEIIAGEIVEDILRLGLMPGDVLPNERAMADSFGVARGTLREALRLLETQGVVRIRPGPRGGPVVRQVQPSDLAGTMTLLLQFMDVPLEEVVSAREELEGVMARLATRNATTEGLRNLQAAIDTMRDGVGDRERFLASNLQFHAGIAEMAENTVLNVLAESLQTITAGLSVSIEYAEPIRTRIADAHQRIVDAMARGDGDGAAVESERHIGEFRRYMERNYPEFLKRPVRWVQIV